MHTPYDEPSPQSIKVDGKRFQWIRTVKGKVDANKIKRDWKRMGNLIRIIPSGVKGWYKVYGWSLK